METLRLVRLEHNARAMRFYARITAESASRPGAFHDLATPAFLQSLAGCYSIASRLNRAEVTFLGVSR